jgi:hypothetical protein
MNGEAAQRRSWTPDEYLAMERSSPEKHEYCDGKVFAMASANEKHNLIVGNVVTALNVATEPQPGSGRRLAVEEELQRRVERLLILSDVSRDVPSNIHGVVQETEDLHAPILEHPVQELVAGTPPAPLDGIQEKARSDLQRTAALRMLDEARQRFFDDLLVAVNLPQAEAFERIGKDVGDVVLYERMYAEACHHAGGTPRRARTRAMSSAGVVSMPLPSSMS